MKTYQYLIALITLVAVIYFSSGCKKENTSNDFLIKIDSIHMPDTIGFGQVLEIDFFGKIGDSDCYTFLRFEQVPPEVGDPQNTLVIKTWGHFEDDGSCKQQEVYMNPATLSVTGYAAGLFRLNAIQPDGSVMTATCFVNQ